ncbi:MAG: response regulator [Clostridiales bacterium]|jgi:putative two-component system response regulator|nr:response regulator [Clostridiales bacterium]
MAKTNEEKQTIILVDDNLTNLIIGENVLSDVYNVITLNSGIRLFVMLTKIIPDLILLDIEMPDIDGYDVIRLLKANPKTADVPVIFLTSLSDEGTEYHGLSLGAIDYIAKPFSPPLLLKRIELHLLLQAQKRELVLINNNLESIVEEKTRTVVDLKNILLSTMAELVEHRDEITGGHIERTRRYIKVLMAGMREHDIYQDEMSAVDEDLVLQSSQLHDLGKISISDSILFKPGKLTTEEFEEIKKHTTFGGKIISRIIEKTPDSDFLQYAKIFAETHHEKWDGSGYPYGLKGEEIPLFGRLMAIADVYDALVTDRPYKAAFPHSKAVQIILEGRGQHFDPILVDLFMKVHQQFERVANEVETGV